MGNFNVKEFADKQIAAIKEQAGHSKRVLLGLSGGVDSSVCAALLGEALGNRCVCVFVDTGLMRKNEGDEIAEIFGKRDLQFIRVDAESRFLQKLKGVTDPEQKRKIIGAEFLAVFEQEANKLGGIELFAQGTIYPDIVESNNKTKSHHNVGGLPDKIDFEGIIEPLKELYKGEVRALGEYLGLPKFLFERQPFPGPGLGVRVIGELTKEKLDILRDADAIVREEIDRSSESASQYFAVLTGMRSVGFVNEARTYDYTVAIRAVITKDFMTGQYAPLSHELLSRISTRITKEVKGVNRVVYDITSKPPATIEWE